MQKTIRGGKIWKGDVLCNGKIGQEIWCRIVVTPVFNNYGEIVQCLFVGADVTEEVLISQTLELRNRLQVEVLATSGLKVVVLDEKAIPVFSDSILLEVFSAVDFEKLKLKNPDCSFFDVCKEAGNSGNSIAIKIWEGISEVFSKEKDQFLMEYSIRSKGDSDSWFYFRCIPLNAMPGKFLLLEQDITSLVESRNKALRLESQYHQTLDSLIEGVQIIDYSWRYVYLNDAAEVHGKRKKEELLGKTMMEMFPGIESTELFELLSETMENRTSNRMENLFTFPDGFKQWFELSIQPTIGGILILSVDISERKKAEEELFKVNEHLEKMVSDRTAELIDLNRELESFSYTVAHDLRGPLRIMNGYGAILNQNYLEDIRGEPKRMLDTILHYSDHMGKLIDDLLDFSRTGRVEVNLNPCNMNEVVENVVTTLRYPEKFPNYDLKIELLDNCLCDSNLIKQVWINLIDNAFKYSSKAKSPEIVIGCKSEINCSVFFVKDNGAGFNPLYADKLFGVFQRLHAKSEFDGTGVGLAIAQRIIRKHGGDIWAESEVGKGAVFYFSLPKSNEVLI